MSGGPNLGRTETGWPSTPSAYFREAQAPSRQEARATVFGRAPNPPGRSCPLRARVSGDKKRRTDTFRKKAQEELFHGLGALRNREPLADVDRIQADFGNMARVRTNLGHPNELDILLNADWAMLHKCDSRVGSSCRPRCHAVGVWRGSPFYRVSTVGVVHRRPEVRSAGCGREEGRSKL